MTAIELISELKGTYERGINWEWAEFPDEESANKFAEAASLGQLEDVVEVRGPYAPTKAHLTWGVRFRW